MNRMFEKLHEGMDEVRDILMDMEYSQSDKHLRKQQLTKLDAAIKKLSAGILVYQRMRRNYGNT